MEKDRVGGGLLAEATKYVDEIWEDVIADIRYLVEVESVRDPSSASEGAPFGRGPAEALGRAIEIADRLGLETKNQEGYIGYGQVRGASDTYIATIAHSDIVPLGEGWTVDPLSVTRRSGYLLGRGVIDDKGPLVLSLWAAHYFVRTCRETGQTLPYTLRCLIGANEETGMADVDYYLAHNPEPAFCFSPDAMFPLICGEKGHFGAEVVSGAYDLSDTVLVSLEGGTAPNAIPGRAQAVVALPMEGLAPAKHIRLEDAEVDSLGRRCTCIKARGRGGHAMDPSGTLNAISLICGYLRDSGVDLGPAEGFMGFERTLLQDSYGRELGVATRDDAFGELTCVGGVVRTETTNAGIRLTQTIDIRYPTSITGAELSARISAVAQGFGLEVAHTVDSVPFYIEPTSPEILALLSSYNEVYGREGEAFTIGGGTYARHFARACAFGPLDPDLEDPDWVGPEHGPDEGVAEISLKRGLVTYILAIARLMELEF